MPPFLNTVAARAQALAAASPEAHKTTWGQFFTPLAIARYMATLSAPPSRSTLRILDPGAGVGLLGCAAALHLLAQHPTASIHVTFVEREPGALAELRTVADELAAQDGRLTVEVVEADFLDLDPRASGLLGPRLESFDLIIANPPYFKLSPKEARGGTAPNAYARFLEASAHLLRPGGELVFIIPRSFTSGFYFRDFRTQFHQLAALAHVHVFDSRRLFDDVLQENIIVRYVRASASLPTVLVTASAGVEDLGQSPPLAVPWRQIRTPGDPQCVLSLPTTPEDLALLEVVHAWPETLSSLGLEISTGPVVPFRATELLLDAPNGTASVPLLWMNHVQPGRVLWPLPGFRKAQHLRADAPELLLVPRSHYVVMRRFSAKEEKRRLTVAPLLADAFSTPTLGLENHLNYIHRPNGQLSPQEAVGLAAVLSSGMLDRFFRISSGNTQVSATEMRAMPLPARPVIEAIGRQIRAGDQRAPDVILGEALAGVARG